MQIFSLYNPWKQNKYKLKANERATENESLRNPSIMKRLLSWEPNNGRCLRSPRCRYTSCGVTKLNQCRVKTGKVHVLYKHFEIWQVCQVSVHLPTAWSSAGKKPWSEWNGAKMWTSAKVCEGLICPVYCDGAEMINITKDQGTQVCAQTYTISSGFVNAICGVNVNRRTKCSLTESRVSKFPSKMCMFGKTY